MAYRFSSFHQHQLISELRYHEAFAIWDRAGALWQELGSRFKVFKSSSVAPNNVTFFGDDRYTLSVGIERASIVDNKPEGSNERSLELFSFFAHTVIGILSINVFERVGTRFIYSIDFKTLREAQKKAEESVPYRVPKKKLFNISPESLSPSFKIEGDDGELAYVAQIYAREHKLDFRPPPDVAALGLSKMEKSLFQLVLDLDFSTKKPMPTESFDALTWLTGWNKIVRRDADAFLELAEKTHV